MPKVSRTGRPGLIPLAERARWISGSSAESLDNRERLFYEAVRAVAAAEVAVSRFIATHSTDVSIKLERLAALHESGGLSDDEFAAAKSRVIGDGTTEMLS